MMRARRSLRLVLCVSLALVQGAGGGPGGQGGAPGGVQTVAELKLLKLLQQDIALRTQQLQQRIDAGEPLDDEDRREYAVLGEEQGRLADLDAILEIMRAALSPQDLVGEDILVTAGPTQESLDPVRFLSNHSSGKMGFALARLALRR